MIFDHRQKIFWKTSLCAVLLSVRCLENGSCFVKYFFFKKKKSFERLLEMSICAELLSQVDLFLITLFLFEKFKRYLFFLFFETKFFEMSFCAVLLSFSYFEKTVLFCRALFLLLEKTKF